MQKILIERNTKWYLGLYDIVLFLNDENLGEIANHETREIELSLGEHTLSAKLKWTIFGSRKIKLKLSDRTNLKYVITYSQFVHNSFLFSLLIFIIFLINSSLKEPFNSINMGLVIIILIYALYTVFFYSNKFLQITQIK